MSQTRRLRRLAPIALAPLVLVLGACATIPSGPSMMALPGTGKTFDQFRYDDVDCRGYANAIVGGQDANQAAVNSGIATAAIGTAVGAAAGAAIGGSQGAGVGAGAGLIFGSAAGAGTAGASSYELQRRYDNGYRQCMYAKGHRVPVSGRFSPDPARTVAAPPPAATATPPAPPSGTPPAPPAPRAAIPPPPPGTPPAPPPR